MSKLKIGDRAVLLKDVTYDEDNKVLPAGEVGSISNIIIVRDEKLALFHPDSFEEQLFVVKVKSLKQVKQKGKK